MGKKKHQGHRGSIDPRLYRDATHKKELEVRNGLLQFDEVGKLIDRSKGRMNLNIDTVKQLHLFAIKDMYREFRGHHA
jgi:hypothetical protein